MKVIFLDVDGVFHFGIEEPGTNKARFEEAPLKRLKRLLEQTRTQIVLSSSWRKKPKDLYEVFVRFEIPLPISVTPIYYGKPRPGWNDRDEEIHQWLKEHPEVTDWAMIDDDKLHLDNSRFFRTFWYNQVVAYRKAQNYKEDLLLPEDLIEKIGLTADLVEKIIEYFNQGGKDA